MLVSIVIPTFNCAPYLQQTIESVLAQTHNNWELILVDDGSTDTTIQLAETAASNNEAIKFYRRNSEKKGGSVCRNIGLKHASGQYVIFLDADDILAPNCLETRLQAAQANPGLDFYVFKIQVFYNTPGDSTNLAVNFDVADPLAAFLCNVYPYPWHTTSPLWCTAFITSIGGFNESYPRLQDPELHTRVLLMPNVKYKLFKDLPPDSYYRFTVKTESQAASAAKFLNGVFIYLTDFIPAIKLYDTQHNTSYTAVFRSMYWNLNKGVKPDFEIFKSLTPVIRLGLKHKLFSRVFALAVYTKFALKALLYC